MGDILTDLFNDSGFCDTSALEGPSSPENLFSILEALDCGPCSPEVSVPRFPELVPSAKSVDRNSVANRKPTLSGSRRGAEQVVSEAEAEAKPNGSKRIKTAGQNAVKEEVMPDGQQRVSHITVERNRRKQMNEHLSVLRSLMPCFYVKRGDQASIIGGVVEFIKELQTVLQSLEAKKQRKAYSEVLSSPRSVSSPRPMSSPKPTPPSPRMSLPISPRTPQPTSPYKPKLHLPHQHPQQQQQQAQPLSFVMSPSLNSPREVHHYDNGVKDLAANSKSPVADVEVKFSGPNVLLKTVSHRIPGQALKIMTALECLSLEILHVSISTVDDTMLNTFTIKIGIECKLSAEELAHEIQQTFHQPY